MALTYTLFHIAIFTIFISFIVSLVYCFRSDKPTYLRIFPFYNFLALTTEVIVTLYYSKENKLNNNTPYNLFSFFEFLLLTYFAFQIISSHKYKPVLLLFSGLQLILFLFLSISNFSFDFDTRKFILPLNIYYILIFFLYLNFTFSKSLLTELSNESSFYIAIGILFYSVINIPALVFFNNNNNLTNLIYIILNDIGYIFLHLLFIKAYTCKAPK